MKLTIIIFFIILSNALHGQEVIDSNNTETFKNKRVFSSLDISILAVGYNLDFKINNKKSIGFNFHFGFDYGFFIPFEKEFFDLVDKEKFSIITLNLKMNHKYSDSFNLDYGLQFTNALFIVNRFDGATSGNYYGLFLSPWIGNKPKLGIKLSIGYSHIDGGSYESLNSFGLYSSLLFIRIAL